MDVYLHDQCAMQPKSYAALKYESANTILAKWGSFGWCSNSGKCQDCELMKPTHLDLGMDKVLVRIDGENRPWLMNRPDKGWGEYGYILTWSFLARLEGWIIGDRYKDDDSDGFWLIRANS